MVSCFGGFPGFGPGLWIPKLVQRPGPGTGPAPILGHLARAQALDPPKPNNAKKGLVHSLSAYLLVNHCVYVWCLWSNKHTTSFCVGASQAKQSYAKPMPIYSDGQNWWPRSQFLHLSLVPQIPTLARSLNIFTLLSPWMNQHLPYIGVHNFLYVGDRWFYWSRLWTPGVDHRRMFVQEFCWIAYWTRIWFGFGVSLWN